MPSFSPYPNFPPPGGKEHNASAAHRVPNGIATGLVCTSYLESCPRTAPLGKAALWTLT